MIRLLPAAIMTSVAIYYAGHGPLPAQIAPDWQTLINVFQGDGLNITSISPGTVISRFFLAVSPVQLIFGLINLLKLLRNYNGALGGIDDMDSVTVNALFFGADLR
jgi:hypothetical protein